MKIKKLKMSRMGAQSMKTKQDPESPKEVAWGQFTALLSTIISNAM